MRRRVDTRACIHHAGARRVALVSTHSRWRPRTREQSNACAYSLADELMTTQHEVHPLGGGGECTEVIIRTTARTFLPTLVVFIWNVLKSFCVVYEFLTCCCRSIVYANVSLPARQASGVFQLSSSFLEARHSPATSSLSSRRSNKLSHAHGRHARTQAP